MATLIRTDGSLQIVSDIHKLAHDDLRSLIGGPTEYILFWNGRALIVNEMSEHKQLSVNKGATSLLQQHQGDVRSRYRGVVGCLGAAMVRGPAILIEASELERLLNNDRKNRQLSDRLTHPVLE